MSHAIVPAMLPFIDFNFNFSTHPLLAFTPLGTTNF